jgi:hypothetical protein
MRMLRTLIQFPIIVQTANNKPDEQPQPLPGGRVS